MVVDKFRKHKWSVPWLHSEAAKPDDKINEIFEVYSIPKAIVVDNSGTVPAMDLGARGKPLEKTINKTLNPP